jgi:glycosyltransferase involved in cell wall biosynthesis
MTPVPGTRDLPSNPAPDVAAATHSRSGKRLRILWIAGSRIVGGAERVTLQVVALLAERGHQVRAIYPFSSALESALRATAIPAAAGRLGGSLNVRAIGTVTRALAAESPDIALVTTADEWVWSCLARRAAPTRLVLVRHMALPLPRKVTWLAQRRADAVIAVSESVRVSLSGSWRIAPTRLHMIPNPVRLPIRDTVPTAAVRRAARVALGLRETGRWIGFFGGAEPRKGLADLLQAAVKIRAAGIDCNLLACGLGLNDPAATDPVRLGAPDGLQSAVHVLGEIDDVATALTACDAVAMPTHSTLSEGMPLVVLEALASGTPVVAYATGGAREALAEGAGLLAQPDNPRDLARLLTQLLAEPDLAGQIAARGLESARSNYAPALAADRYEELFRGLCAS